MEEIKYIKPSDLRLGNYVNLWGTVAMIQRADFSEEGPGIAVDKGKPIKLTNKWLEAFGFKKEKYHYLLKTNYFKLFIQENTTLGKGGYLINRKVDITPNQIDFICKCEYVHSLQNIFHALAGRDLILEFIPNNI